MSNIKFTQLPNLANVADNTIVPVVNLGVNYTVTAANLKTYTSNVTTLTASGNITGNYIIGNGSALTSLTGANVTGTVANATYATSSGTAGTAGTVTTAAQPNITTVGTLTSVSSTGNITTTGNISAVGNIETIGNISGTFFFGNGSQLTGLPVQYSNANVASFLAVYGSNTISSTGNTTSGNLISSGRISAVGNITGAFFFGNGSQLTGLPATYSNANVASFLAAYGANTISSTGNITTTANVQAGNLISNTLTATGGNLLLQTDATSNVIASGRVLTVGTGGSNANIHSRGPYALVLATNYGAISSAITVNPGTNGSIGANLVGTGSFNITGSGNVSATGRVTAAFFSGNGSLLTNLPGANVTGQVANALVAGTVYTAAQPNITSVGTLTVLNTSGTISAAGNITSASNIAGGNLSMTGTVQAATVGASSTISATGNVSGGNISTTGNVTGSYIIGNGSLLTNVSSGTAVNAQNAANVAVTDNTVSVSTWYPTFVINTAGNNPITVSSSRMTFVPSTGTFSVLGTITGGNLATGGTVSATGTITGGNLATGGTASAGGNITGGNLITSGLITATGTVTAASVATAGTVSATGNITGGNITSSGRVQAVNYSETVYAFGNATGTISPNISLGAIQSMTVTGNITLNSLTNIATGQSATLILTQDGVGNRTLSSTWKFAGNSRTLSTAANSTDIISVFYDGSSYYAVLTKGYL